MPLKQTVLVLVLLAIVLPAHGAESSDAPRVRLTSTNGNHTVGTLVGLDEDALRLMVDREGGREVRVQRAEVTTIEVRQRRSTRRKWIGRGLLAGILIGAGLGAATESDCGPAPSSNGDATWLDLGYTLCHNLKGANTAAGAIVGAAAGSLLGLAVSHGEKWQVTPIGSVRLAAGGSRGAVGLRITFRF